MSQSAMADGQRPMRPRAATGMSVVSDNSNRSAGNNRESNDEKRKTHTVGLSETTKANPNAAMNELQPTAVQLEKATIVSLRGGQYSDVYGNPITDPDLSNPTRRRTERPLETIRSFEAAIESEYKRNRTRPESMLRSDTAPDGYDFSSRRSSSYWGNGAPHDQNGSRVSNVGGYYNQRGGNGGNRDSYHDNPRRHTSRNQSEHYLNRHNNNAPQGVYPIPGYGQSSATVNTGGSNGSASEPWHNSTDPSSENSSIDRVKTDGHDGLYGHPQQSREPIAEEGHYTYGNSVGNGYNAGYMNAPQASGAMGPPAVPPKMSTVGQPSERKVIPLGASTGGPVQSSGERPSMVDQPKRKSWLRRTLSRS